MRKKIKIISVAAVVFLLAAFWYFLFYKNNRSGNEEAVFVSKENAEQILGEQTIEDNQPKSANYKMPFLGFGGEETFLAETGQAGNLKIIDPESQLVRTKDKKDTELIVKWKTTKPAKCLLAFSKPGGQEKSVEENNFVIEHQAVLKQLDTAATYNYEIEARDRIGATLKSDKFVFYTGAPELSLIDLLSGAFKDIFGWAMQK